MGTVVGVLTSKMNDSRRNLLFRQNFEEPSNVWDWSYFIQTQDTSAMAWTTATS